MFFKRFKSARIIFIALIAILTASIIPTTIAKAQSSGSYAFIGHGYGHGVGMSMTSVWHMSKPVGGDPLYNTDGGYSRILQYFYSGISWGTMDDNTGIRVQKKDGSIIWITMKEYLYRQAEEPEDMPREGLRATIVAMRTYAWEKVYRNLGTLYVPNWGQAWDPAINPANRPNIVAAVNYTAGQLLTVGDPKKPIVAAYSSSSGGYTAKFEDVWGSPFAPYCERKPAPWDGLGANANWQKTIAISALEAAYPSIGSFRGLEVVQRNGVGDWGGRVVRIKIIGSADSTTATGWNFAGKLGLKSNYFNFSNTADNWYVRKAASGGFESMSSWSTLWGNIGDTPLVGNFDGDRFVDIAIFRPSTSSWYVNRSSGSGFTGAGWAAAWGNAGDKPLVGDFNGDGKTDIAIYRTGSYPNWFFKLSTGGGFAPQTSPLSWGNTGGDTPFVGDFNGDGKSDIGIYRTGSYPNWFFRRSPSGPTGAFSWGNAGGDTPIVGDFNGDGKTDIGVYRTGSYPNWFFLRAKPDGNGFLAPQDTWPLNWGNAGGDEPIVGDFNGDRRDDIGIFRQSVYPNWFTNNSGTYGFDIFSDTASSWGNSNTDRPIIGDFSGDGLDDMGLYRSP